jgi:hypothetical protein
VGDIRARSGRCALASTVVRRSVDSDDQAASSAGSRIANRPDRDLLAQRWSTSTP